jgi:flagellar protein FliO/FliZ
MIFEIIRYVGALLLVLALIGVAGVAARKWGVPGVTRAVEQKRLAVVETLLMGPRQRLFIVRRDNVEHLIFAGPEGACLIENISSPSALRVASAATGTSPTSADARGGGRSSHESVI